MEISVKAFYSSFAKKNNFRLIIVGSGPEKQNLINLINQLGLSNQVKLIGQINQIELSSLIKKCHAFLLSSYHETFGVSIIEAMACGLPAISTRCGGPEDIINLRNGYLGEVGSIEDITIYMKKIYSNYSSFNLNEIAKETKDKFGFQTFIKNTLKLYESIK